MKVAEKMNKNPWYDDINEIAYMNAIFKFGNFVDAETHERIILKENTTVRISIPLYGIQEGQKKKHNEVKRYLLLKKHTNLNFHFYYDNKSFEFLVILLDDLYLSKKGNQFSRLEPCKCVVNNPNRKYASDFETDSLNQAFTKASIEYRPNNKSHTCNVFKTFRYKDEELENLRLF